MSAQVIADIMKRTRDADFYRRLALVPFYGAEGEGEGQESQGEGEQGGEGGGQATTPEPTTTPPAKNDRTYTHEEMQKAIEESKNYRKRAQDAESKLAEHEKAQMSELERAKTEREEAIKARDEAQSLLRRTRFEAEVMKAAAAANFTDPSDAITMIGIETIEVDDEGKPKTNSLAAALKRLSDQKPYLLKTYVAGSGSGDGGSRGGTTPDRSAEYAKEYQSRGMVEVPA